MDDSRLGLAVRAMRRRRGWRQSDLGERADVSQGLISLLERGHVMHISVVAMRRVLAALDARLDLVVHWRGGELDRLVDQKHAWIVEEVIRILRAEGWEVRPEVTFSHFGDRGSVDVLAWNTALGAVLLIEVKSEVYSLEDTLRRFHVKVRLAPQIALDSLGWRPRWIGAALVVPESSGARRRLDVHAETIASAFPDRGRELRPWLRRPNRDLTAIWFLSASKGVAPARVSRVRVVAGQADPPPGSNVTDLRQPASAVPSGIGVSPDRPIAPGRTPLVLDDRSELARAGFVWGNRDGESDG